MQRQCIRGEFVMNDAIALGEAVGGGAESVCCHGVGSSRIFLCTSALSLSLPPPALPTLVAEAEKD